MELLLDDQVLKVTIKKRKNENASSNPMSTNVVTPALTKDVGNCQIGLRKSLGNENVQYFFSMKTLKNKQIGKERTITFIEPLYDGPRVQKTFDVLTFRPDRSHSQKKGNEIEFIQIQFGSPDLCDKWEKALSDFASQQQGLLDNTGSDQFSPKQKKSNIEVFKTNSEKSSRRNSDPVRRAGSDSPKNPMLTTNDQVNAAAKRMGAEFSSSGQSSPLSSNSGAFSNSYLQPQTSTFASQPQSSNADMNVNALYTMILQLSQRVDVLTQEVAQLKQASSSSSPLTSNPFQATPISPFQTNQSFSRIGTSNPFATGTM